MTRLLTPAVSVVGAGILALAPAVTSRAAPIPSPAPVRVAVSDASSGRDGVLELHATASSRGARVAAVTFLLDGRVLGSDTTAPYSLELPARELGAGPLRLRALAVDARGRRAASATRTIRTRAHPAPREITASPHQGLRRALAALRAGHVAVRLLPGRYLLTEPTIGSGATLIGSGPATVLEPANPSSYFAVLSVAGSRIRISDLTIDGSGPGSGAGIAVAIRPHSSNVTLQRLHLKDVRRDGVNVWGAHSGISVQDSWIKGNGSAHAGVVALESAESRNTSVIRTHIAGFRSYGILFAQKEYGRRSAGLHALALDNRISDVVDPARSICTTKPLSPGCGTNEAGIQTGAVRAVIAGNTVERTAWDGIETVGSSTGVAVVDNRITATRVGIYLEHATNRSLFARNAVADVRTGINVEWRYSGVGSSRNVFFANRVVRAYHSGLFVDVGGDANVITGNVFLGGARPAIVLQGTSANVVRGNRGCGTRGPLVHEQSGSWDDGSKADARENAVAENLSLGTCPQG
jgi:hypothetical protein